MHRNGRNQVDNELWSMSNNSGRVMRKRRVKAKTSIINGVSITSLTSSTTPGNIQQPIDKKTATQTQGKVYSYEDCIDIACKHNKRVLQLHHSVWVHLFPLIKRLFTCIMSNDAQQSMTALTAFLVLPSICKNKRISAIRDNVTNWMIDFQSILVKAASTQKPFRRPNVDNHSNPLRLSQLISKMRKEAAWSELQDSNGGDVDYTDPRTIEQVKVLHPDATNKDILPNTDVTEGIIVDHEDILRAINNLNSKSANGIGSWTYPLIQLMIRHADDFNNIVSSITNLFNHIYAGKLQPDTAKVWSTSRLVLIKKADGTSLRPISVTDAWYRLLAIVLNKKLAKQVGAQLNSIQVGVGTADGASIGSRLAQFVYDKNCSILSLDMTNAFNSISRLYIDQGIQKYAPTLLPWFRTFYRSASQLRSSQGDFMGWSSTGVKQGDPLGPMLFCLGIHSSLLQIQNILPLTNRRSASAGDTAFMDDIFMWVPHQLTSKLNSTFLKSISKILAELNLTVNNNKSHILLSKVRNSTSSSASNVKVVSEGIKILGAPIGNSVYQKAFVENEITQLCSGIQRLENLYASDAFILLNFCINSVPIYLR